MNVARSKGKKLHFVEPTLVRSQRLNGNVGYLKVAMFPGMLGVDVANEMSQAIAELNGVEGLIEICEATPAAVLVPYGL